MIEAYDATLFVTGYMDEVKLYCKTLKSSEVLAHYVDTEPDHSNDSFGALQIGDPDANQVIGGDGFIIGNE